jgi:hypothetical protein
LSIRSWLTIALLLAAVVPLSGAGAASTGCRVNTYAAIDLGGGLYMYGTAKEFWQESNGEAGLQRTATFCKDGPSIPADTCIVHSETFAALDCGAEYAAASLAA